MIGMPYMAVTSSYLLRFLDVPHRHERGLGFVLREPETDGSLTKSRVGRPLNATPGTPRRVT